MSSTYEEQKFAVSEIINIANDLKRLVRRKPLCASETLLKHRLLQMIQSQVAILDANYVPLEPTHIQETADNGDTTNSQNTTSNTTD